MDSPAALGSSSVRDRLAWLRGEEEEKEGPEASVILGRELLPLNLAEKEEEAAPVHVLLPAFWLGDLPTDAHRETLPLTPPLMILGENLGTAPTSPASCWQSRSIDALGDHPLMELHTLLLPSSPAQLPPAPPFFTEI